MDKLDRIINGLKDLKAHFRAMAGISTSREGRRNHAENARIIGDAIELLKEQEPRVMTLEEAYNAELVWYDQINTGVRPAKVIRVPHKTGVYRVIRFGDIDAWEHAYEYGEFWRCWTSHPTEEQREATTWKNEEEANQ